MTLRELTLFFFHSVKDRAMIFHWLYCQINRHMQRWNDDNSLNFSNFSRAFELNSHHGVCLRLQLTVQNC